MIVGTRGSKLARVQTDLFVSVFRERHPDVPVEIKTVATTGDRVKDRPLSSLGGLGAFTKELDQQIVAGNIDVAVNSLKDMPVKLTPGVTMVAVLPRGPVEDVVVPSVLLDDLPPGAVVGTSSVRRRALVLSRRKDLVLRELRGNVPTRLRKVKEREYDAIIVARAGLERLGYDGEYLVLDPSEFVPAAGQGVIAAVCGEGSRWEPLLRSLDDRTTRIEVEAERHILKELGGGCSVPIGVYAKVDGESLKIMGVVLSEDGSRAARASEAIPIDRLPAGLESISAKLRRGMEEVS